jgi:REP-associated tyrosine transposase
MARDLRLEFAGALYHLTARGNEQQAIFRDDSDRRWFLKLLAREVAQQRWQCHAYCLMGNHYHLLIETTEPNLARGMRRLNSAYAQGFNHRHGRVGHLFQGRYHSVLVEKESYLLEVSRYIVLNPVRASLVCTPEEWAWSSYRATSGLEPAPAFLQVDWLLGIFSDDIAMARPAYVRFVHSENATCPWDDLRDRIWLGSESFRTHMKDFLKGKELEEIPRTQQQPLRPTPEQIIASVLEVFGLTEHQLWARADPEAFRTTIYLLRRVGNLPIQQVATMSRVSRAWVSTIQRQIENGRRPAPLDELLCRYNVQVSEGTAPEYKVKIRPHQSSRAITRSASASVFGEPAGQGRTPLLRMR